MRNLIAVATGKDKRSIWKGHFGMSPFYSIFDNDGNLIEQKENPYAKGDKHHDDPNLIVNLLDNVYLFIAHNMGKKSREKLTKELGIKSLLVDTEDIYSAIDYFLQARKNIDVFEECTQKYEEWFDKYSAIYESELNMLKSITPKFERALEIGVGSGRFAAPLGIKEGIEPSEKMAQIAKQRGIKVYPGFAENLPFMDEEYDFILIAVTICFVKDPKKTLKEAYRVLKKGGKIIVAIVDKASAIGKEYLNKKEKGRFYRYVTFFSAEELQNILKETGFEIENTYQTLFGRSIKEIDKPQDFKEGYGEGGFVAVLATK
ncbi:methyltransferase domain-containing protein [Hippea sp. KM1]|uniref:methyltransferase domain-containing protein n=1 Tax=Hippea sp. KM1 TaxID=944481 RepID=UPI0004B79C40|nr:methyltransferase domain-containing protein [Hippea sp. KM1]